MQCHGIYRGYVDDLQCPDVLACTCCSVDLGVGGMAITMGDYGDVVVMWLV